MPQRRQAAKFYSCSLAFFIILFKNAVQLFRADFADLTRFFCLIKIKICPYQLKSVKSACKKHRDLAPLRDSFLILNRF